MESQYNLRSPAVKRLMKEAQELREATEQFYAQPLEDNLFEWHFTIRGPADSEFEGGIYHGRIILPPEYPMKPPSIILLTPNGRFETHKKICLSISGYHPESWQPSWSLRTALLAIIGFMPTHGNGAIGSLDYTPEERKVLARKSVEWKCDDCGHITNLVRPVTEASQALSKEAKELGSQINLQGEKEKEKTVSADTATSDTSTVSDVPPAQPVSFPFPVPPFFPPFDALRFQAAPGGTVPPGVPPFMPVHPSYMFGQVPMPFVPPGMTPFYGGLPPVSWPQNMGPGAFHYMGIPNSPVSSTMTSSLHTPIPSTSVAASGNCISVAATPATVAAAVSIDDNSSLVSTPVPSSSSEVSSEAAVNSSSGSTSTSAVQSSSPSTVAAPSSSQPSSSSPQLLSSLSQPSSSLPQHVDDDPVLSANELRRRHVGRGAHVRTSNQPADLRAEAASHGGMRLLGNVVLAVLIICIVILLARRLYLFAVHY